MLADANLREIALVDIGLDPDLVERSNSEETHSRIDRRPIDDVLLDDEAARGARDDDAFERRSLRRDGLHLCIAEPEQVQPLTRSAREDLDSSRARTRSSGRTGSLRRKQKILLRVVELWAVERKERLPHRNALPRLADEELRDPTLDLEIHVGELRLVVGDLPYGAECAAHRALYDLPGSYADELASRFVDHDDALLLLLLRHGDEVHAADRALPGSVLLHRRVHRAGVVVDLSRCGRRARRCRGRCFPVARVSARGHLRAHVGVLGRARPLHPLRVLEHGTFEDMPAARETYVGSEER